MIKKSSFISGSHRGQTRPNLVFITSFFVIVLSAGWLIWQHQVNASYIAPDNSVAAAQMSNSALDKNTEYILLKGDSTDVANVVANENAQVDALTTQKLAPLGITRLKINSGLSTAEEVAARVQTKLNQRHPNHKPHEFFAEVDARLSADAIPNDPKYPSQWHWPNISAPAGWDTETGTGVATIAIVDSGVDCTNPDLQPRCVPGYNFYDNNTNTADVYGHGTAVAGTAAAAGNNGLHVTGADWNAHILPVRISDTTGWAYFSTIATGIEYAADQGAKVINISYGVSASSTDIAAAQYANSKDALVVASAANDNVDPGYSNSPSILVVAATDQSNAKASFSDFGAFIDMTAPGVSILTTNYNGEADGYWSGTSFSSPIVAGVAALMRDLNPSLTYSQVQDILTSTADDLGATGYDTTFGWGKVNVARALAVAKSTAGGGGGSTSDTTVPSVPTGLTATVSGSGSINLTWTASTDNVGVTGYQVWRGTTEVATVGSTSYSDTGLTGGTTYTYTVKAYDAAGNVSAASTAASATTSTATVTFSTAPVVLSKTTTSAMITWTTSVPSTGVLYYGTTAFSSQAADTTLATSHTVVLSNLSASTAYKFYVVATAGSSSATSAQLSFKTARK